MGSVLSRLNELITTWNAETYKLRITDLPLSIYKSTSKKKKNLEIKHYQKP